MVRYIGIAFFFLPVIQYAQDLNFGNVEKFPTQVNSNCEETCPVFSMGKGTLYFARVDCPRNTGGTFAGSDIWATQLNPRTYKWGAAENKGSMHNDRGNNAIVGVSRDGNTVYHLNTHPTRTTKGISISKFVDNRWTSPELILLPFLETTDFLGIHVSPDCDVILVSMNGVESRGQEDLYVSIKNESGQWSNSRNLGPTINTPGYEISPFLSKDKKRIYFASSGHKGLGDADIFYSDRLDDSWEKWSEPVNLGDRINSKKFDAYFSIYDSIAFFSSNRSGTYADIYQATLDSGVDSTRLRIEKIVSDANTLLTEISGAPASAKSLQSAIIEFDKNSSNINSSAKVKLTKAGDAIKARNARTVTLIAHPAATSPGEESAGGIWSKRLESLKVYLQNSIPGLLISFDFNRDEKNELNVKNSSVEIRY